MDFQALTDIILQYRYLVLFPLAAFEGPVVAIAAGVLVGLDHLSFFPVLVVLYTADLIPDIVYFFIGKLSRESAFLARFGHRFGITEKRLHFLEQQWHLHPFRSMFFGKLAYGLSTPLLISAGLSRISLKTFLTYGVPITVVHNTLLLTLATEFGASYEILKPLIQYAEVVIGVAVLILFIAYVLLTKYIGRHVFDSDKRV